MTSIPPPVASATTAPGAPTAPAGHPAAVLTQLPGAQPTTPGTVITGTVMGRDNQGQFLLQTDAGVVAFKSAAALTVGAQVSLQIQAVGSQLQAVILSALAAGTKGATNQAPAPGRTPATGGAPAAPATTIAPSVSGGAVVTATIIGPSGAPVPASTTGSPPSTATEPAVNTTNTAPQTSTPAAARAASQSPQAAFPSLPPPSASPSASAAPSAATLVAQQTPAAGAADVSTAAARYAATSGNVATGASPTPSAQTTGAPQPPANAVSTAGNPNASLLQPAATGTTVQLRLAAPLPGAPATAGSTPVTGTLVAHTPNGQTLIDTPIGRLTLNLPAGLGQPKIGSPIALEIVSVGGAVPTASLAATNAKATLPTLGQDWPTLKAAINALASVDPSFARQLVDVVLPRLGTPRFLSQLLGQLVTGGAADSRSLLGDTAHALLERAGRRDVLAALDAELREMNRLNSGPSDWRVLFLPITDMNELRQLRVYTRKKKGGDKGKERSGRFIVEADFEEYGPLQIDGLVQKPRIDVIVRSHAEFTPSMQAGIAEVFGRTCDASGLIGKIFFHAAPHFPVSPLDEIAAHAGPGLSV